MKNFIKKILLVLISIITSISSINGQFNGYVQDAESGLAVRDCGVKIVIKNDGKTVKMTKKFFTDNIGKFSDPSLHSKKNSVVLISLNKAGYRDTAYSIPYLTYFYKRESTFLISQIASKKEVKLEEHKVEVQVNLLSDKIEDLLRKNRLDSIRSNNVLGKVILDYGGKLVIINRKLQAEKDISQKKTILNKQLSDSLNLMLRSLNLLSDKIDILTKQVDEYLSLLEKFNVEVESVQVEKIEDRKQKFLRGKIKLSRYKFSSNYTNNASQTIPVKIEIFQNKKIGTPKIAMIDGLTRQNYKIIEIPLNSDYEFKFDCLDAKGMLFERNSEYTIKLSNLSIQSREIPLDVIEFSNTLNSNAWKGNKKAKVDDFLQNDIFVFQDRLSDACDEKIMMSIIDKYTDGDVVQIILNGSPFGPPLKLESSFSTVFIPLEYGNNTIILKSVSLGGKVINTSFRSSNFKVFFHGGCINSRFQKGFETIITNESAWGIKINRKP